MSDKTEKKTERIGPNGKVRRPGECLFCGYVTPFDPDVPGFCCPVCGAQSGTVYPKKQ